MGKEGKIEKQELSEEEKVAKEKILEIVKNSEYYTPKAEEEIGQEMEGVFQEKSIEMGIHYFVEKLEQLNAGFYNLSPEESQKEYSNSVLWGAYYRKFRKEYNKETGKEVETLNNFWKKITIKPPILSTKQEEYLAEEEVQKMDNYLEKEFPKRDNFKLEEIKKDVGQAIERTYNKQAIEKFKEWHTDYDYAMERAALYGLTGKIIKERFKMSQEEFSEELNKYFGMSATEEDLPPKEFAEKFVDWENKTFEVYEEARKLAEVEERKDINWTA